MRRALRTGQQQDIDMESYHPFRSEAAREKYLSLYEARAKQWPVPSETRMADTSYGRTFVRISGPDNAAPLVLLPGAAVTSLMWIPNIRALSSTYRTYAVDNIYDYGRSVYTRPLRGADDFVAWLDELFDALRLGNAVRLVGMSYGGWVAGRYALRFPHRLSRVVLLAPACTAVPLSLAFKLRVVLVALPFRFAARSFLNWMFDKGLTRGGNGADVLLENAVDDLFTASRCFKRKRFVIPTVMGDGELRSIDIPVLFLVGRNEKIYSAEKAVRRLNRVAPRIRTEIIPDAGHVLTIEQTDLVNERILEFLGPSRPEGKDIDDDG